MSRDNEDRIIRETVYLLRHGELSPEMQAVVDARLDKASDGVLAAVVDNLIFTGRILNVPRAARVFATALGAVVEMQGEVELDDVLMWVRQGAEHYRNFQPGDECSCALCTAKRAN